MVSLSPRPERFKPRDPEVMESIGHLVDHPGMKALIDEAGRARDTYFANLAAGLATQATPVDQREVDEKRGFWKGVFWALEALPKMNERALEKYVEAALEESEKE